MKKKLVYIFLCIPLLIWAYFMLQYAFLLNNFSYFQADYAEKKYDAILEGFSDAKIGEAYTLHNLWNTLVQKWIESKNEDQREFLIWALNFYSGALRIWENEFSRYNYDLVEKFLGAWGNNPDEKAQKDTDSGQAEDSEESSSENDGKDWEWEENSASQTGSEDSPEDASWSTDTQDESSQNQKWGAVSPRDEEYYLDEDTKLEDMSEQEKQELEAAIEQLKKEQIYNQQFFNTKEQESEFGSLFDNFFGNIDRGGEKDW